MVQLDIPPDSYPLGLDFALLKQADDFEVLKKVKDKNTIIVLNKCELPSALDKNKIVSCILNPRSCILNISATRGDGLDELKEKIFESCLKNWEEEREGVVITNIRHKTSIQTAKILPRQGIV